MSGKATLYELSTQSDKPVSVTGAVSARRVRIPSHTAHIIDCDLKRDMPDFILEQARICSSGIVTSRTNNSAGTHMHARLYVLNMTYLSYIIKKGTKVGEVISASSVQGVDHVVRRMAVGRKDNAIILLPRVFTWSMRQ